MTSPANPRYTCVSCDSELSADERPCPRCGSEQRNVTVSVHGVESISVVDTLGLVAESPPSGDKPLRLRFGPRSARAPSPTMDLGAM